MNTLRAGLAGMALVLMTAPVAAETSRATVFQTVRGADVVRIMSQASYKPKLSDDSYGDPLVSVTSGGLIYEIQFYGCETAEPRECTSLMYSAGFDANGSRSPELMNLWNRDRRFTRAYMEEDGDLRLEMDVVVAGGVTEDMLGNHVSVWDEALAEFSSHIGW